MNYLVVIYKIWLRLLTEAVPVKCSLMTATSEIVTVQLDITQVENEHIHQRNSVLLLCSWLSNNWRYHQHIEPPRRLLNITFASFKCRHGVL